MANSFSRLADGHPDQLSGRAVSSLWIAGFQSAISCGARSPGERRIQGFGEGDMVAVRIGDHNGFH